MLAATDHDERAPEGERRDPLDSLEPLDEIIAREAPVSVRVPGRPGRPRSDTARRAICDAFRAILVEDGYGGVRMEHVAARAGVGKATIYRHWPTKQALAHEVLLELTVPYIVVPDVGDTRSELLATLLAPMRAMTETKFGPVIQALLSEIARVPSLNEPFRESVVNARRAEVARVIARGIRRGDLRPDIHPDIATEMLLGPLYFRLMFGGELDDAFAEQVVDEVLQGWSMRGWGEIATNWL